MIIIGFCLIMMLFCMGAVPYALGWQPHLHQMGPAEISQTPVEILNARYARGEITYEEYDQIRRDLEG